MLRESQPTVGELSSPPVQGWKGHTRNLGAWIISKFYDPSKPIKWLPLWGTSVSTFVNLRVFFLSSVMTILGQVNPCGAGC